MRKETLMMRAWKLSQKNPRIQPTDEKSKTPLTKDVSFHSTVTHSSESHTYIYLYSYISIYTQIYIYTYRERAREIDGERQSERRKPDAKDVLFLLAR